MGVGVSLDRDTFPAREAIIRLCSEEKVRDAGDDNDDEAEGKGPGTFRTIMRSQFGVTTSQSDVDTLDHIALPLCLRLMKNNLWTNNFPCFLSAVLTTLDRTLAVPADSITEDDVLAATGGLCIVRIALQHMIASHKGARLLTQMEGDAETARAAFQCLLHRTPPAWAHHLPHNQHPSRQQHAAEAVNGGTPAVTMTTLPKEQKVSGPFSTAVEGRPTTSAISANSTPAAVGAKHDAPQFRSTALLLSLRHLLLRPLATASLALHVEAVSAVLVLGSVQLYASEHPLSFSMLDAFVTDARTAHDLFVALHRVLLDMRKADLRAEDENIFRDLATLFSLPFHMVSTSSSERAQRLSAASWAELRTRVMLLTLVLWAHTPCQGAVRSRMRAPSTTNHFLAALSAACQLPPHRPSSSSSWLSWRAAGRTQGREVTVLATQREQHLIHSDDEASHQSISQRQQPTGKHLYHKEHPFLLPPPHISFDPMADVLATYVGQPAGSLFAYNWVYRNPGLRRHLLNSDTHFRPFMLECLRALNKETCPTPQATTLVSLLLVMSSDTLFYQRLLRETVGEDAPWHTERDLDGASVTSLLVSVLLRCLNHNWRVDRDEELHRQALALLCNLSPHIARLDLYVCQRLIRLLHALLRQLFRLRTDADILAAQHTGEELAETIRFVHVLLRVINTVITSTVSSNADLMYTLLINKQDFTGLRRHDLFSPEIDNIHSAIMYCEAKLSQSRSRSTRSSSRIQQDLEAAVSRFPSDLLQRTPHHRYAYEEDETADGRTAMCRRVWRCVVDHGNIFPADHGYPFTHDEDR